MSEFVKPVEQLSRQEAKEELIFLARRLAELDDAYYQDDAPLLSDSQYDALKRRNFEIEAKYPDLILANSPSLKVGAMPADGFLKIEHKTPMLSLENLFEPRVRG